MKFPCRVTFLEASTFEQDMHNISMRQQNYCNGVSMMGFKLTRDEEVSSFARRCEKCLFGALFEIALPKGQANLGTPDEGKSRGACKKKSQTNWRF